MEDFVIKHFKFLILGILLLTCIAGIIIVSNKYKNISEIAKQTDYYYYTWADFQNLSAKKLHAMWNEKYHDVTYQLNGDAKYNVYDCTSAIYWIMRDLKSNFTLLPVSDLHKLLDVVSFKRKSFNDVQIKDLIVLYINGAYHIAIIEGKRNEKIIYMDVNVADNGPGYKTINYNSGYIKGIYPITFALWKGDIDKNVKELKNKL